MGQGRCKVAVPLQVGLTPFYPILTKEGIARKIVSEVSDVNWAGKQYMDLPYTTTILDGSSDAGDDCPANDFCVAFWRVFKGTEGNYGIPFGDRDYSH